MERVRVDPLHPEPDAVARAAATLRAGGLVVLPTDTLYGLAANPFDEAAVERVYIAKGRPADRALPLVAADMAQVVATFGSLARAAAALAGRFWPGPLTLLLPPPSRLVSGVSAGTGRVGVRVPDHAVARALCHACGFPLTATSANTSGRPPTADPAAIDPALLPAIDLIVDAGTTPGGLPSTVVDVSGGAPVLVRAGALEWREISACLHDLPRLESERPSSG